MTLIIEKGDCLELMKELPDASIDLFICDLPYGETNCGWDSVIDMDKFWEQFRRLRKSKRTACIHFCSTKFGYTLIKSWEAGYKMDMVWKKRNKTGGLQSRHRPMRNHEMVYFFYEQSPKYNRDKYHKRIAVKEHNIEKEDLTMGKTGIMSAKDKSNDRCFDPPNPGSVVEPKYKTSNYKEKVKKGYGYETGPGIQKNKKKEERFPLTFEPPNPASVVEDEPVSMFESSKVFIGKRHHQTEKPQDILEFFLKYWTDEGDTVLDPTMGSGSTGVACKKLDRDFIGFEKDDNIFKVAESRLK